MASPNENAPAGKQRGYANMAKRADIISIRDTQINQQFIGSQAWRQATGLQTLSDLAQDYEFNREPRGSYFVPLPEDLCG